MYPGSQGKLPLDWKQPKFACVNRRDTQGTQLYSRMPLAIQTQVESELRHTPWCKACDTHMGRQEDAEARHDLELLQVLWI